MPDIRYLISRFWRRFAWFLVAATTISAVAVVIAFSLPSVYRSELRLIVESKQIPDELAESTVSTPALEQLQIVEQRLLTRDNLLDIAGRVMAVRDQKILTPDEIVAAMKENTTLKSSSGRNAATMMSITYDGPNPDGAAAVLDAYLALILREDAEFRTGRAVTTLDFFRQQVARLGEELDTKSGRVLEFKNSVAKALPETLTFRMSEVARLQDKIAQIDGNLSKLGGEREQTVQRAEFAKQLAGLAAFPRSRLTPRQQLLYDLEAELGAALSVYSEANPKVRQLRSRIGRIESTLEAEEVRFQAVGGGAGPDVVDPLLMVDLVQIDAQMETLEEQKVRLESEVDELRRAIEQTPANAMTLAALERELQNTQRQYNTAVNRLSRASTGERIEQLARGQRIKVVEPPAIPDGRIRPNRIKLAGGGVLMGLITGVLLVYLVELLDRTPKRPEDIVARFEVMPIATIPYVRSRQEVVFGRALKLLILVTILIGVPATVWTVHRYYVPLDLVTQKILRKAGADW